MEDRDLDRDDAMENSLLDVRYIICDVGGENRPTGAYFITEFDLTKVVIGIFVRKFSDILLLYRSSTIH